MSEIKTYRDLIVWQKAKLVALHVYKLTNTFPDSEKFGLTSQIRRASISIVANIAEGKGRSTKRDYANFLHIALGSCHELESELDISKDLKFAPSVQYEIIEKELNDIQKMLTILILKLKS